MITLAALKGLRESTSSPVHVVKTGATVLIYASWFVLEVPGGWVDPSFKEWESLASAAAAAWRTRMPAGEGEYAQGTRWVPEKEKETVVKLISDSGVALMAAPLYELVMKRVPEPEFRIFSGEAPYIAIVSAGNMIGGTAQLRIS